MAEMCPAYGKLILPLDGVGLDMAFPLLIK